MQLQVLEEIWAGGPKDHGESKTYGEAKAQLLFAGPDWYGVQGEAFGFWFKMQAAGFLKCLSLDMPDQIAQAPNQIECPPSPHLPKLTC